MNLSPNAHAGAHSGDHLPMTSLIDVVFLLLIFFMLTASFVASETELASALQRQSEGVGAATDLQPQILTVAPGRNGTTTYTIGARVLTTQADLTALLANLPKEGGIFLRIDGATPVNGAASALQACKDAGFRKVSYVPTE